MSILPENLLLPQRTIAGAGSIFKLSELIAGFGAKGIIVHGKSLERSGVLNSLVSSSANSEHIATYCHDGGEPTVEQVDALRKDIINRKTNWMAAIGGGSVIDLTKAAAGLACHSEPTAFYQANPSKIRNARIPVIAAPTTAGTGSEATVVSVLTNTKKELKQSIRHPSHMPKAVILDPQLLAGCPPSTIAAAGLDAFVQAFESYTSRYAVPFTKALAECAIGKIATHLLPFFNNPADNAAAAEMLEASYITGMAFSHSRLGVIHGLAHPLGSRFRVAHGLVCACCLPASLEYNREYIQEHLEVLKSHLGIDIIELVDNWMAAMKLDNPFTGKEISDMDTFIKETLGSGSTKANPREVTDEDVKWFVKRICAN
ncbi:MAG: iron-containing alcohol dehydrogenase [Kiritimatiellia bacterium]